MIRTAAVASAEEHVGIGQGSVPAAPVLGPRVRRRRAVPRCRLGDRQPPRRPRVRQVLRRAAEALGEIGWRRGADGNMANAAGEHVTIPLWTTQGGQWEAEIAITADNWRAIGLGVDEYVIPGPQSRDRELRARFPGFSSTPIPFDFLRQVTAFYGPECPSER